jgi:hypothetical protein
MKRVMYGWMHSGNTHAPFYVDGSDKGGAIDILANAKPYGFADGAKVVKVKITVETCERKKRKPQTKIANCAICGKQPDRSTAIGESGIIAATCYNCFDCGNIALPSPSKRGAVSRWNTKQKGYKK